jgi:hypothetical protein
MCGKLHFLNHTAGGIYRSYFALKVKLAIYGVGSKRLKTADIQNPAKAATSELLQFLSPKHAL